MADRSEFDDPAISASYAQLRLRPGRPNDAIEQPALQSLMPEVDGKFVVDLGCGTGQMARWVVNNGARSVLAFDASEKMISEAVSLGDNSQIHFRKHRIEDVDLPDGSVDIVMSGLALHYVADFPRLAGRIRNWLRESGSLVFSVEHPIMTCSTRKWIEAPDGTRMHWPVDRYLDEGSRTVEWLGTVMPREHRTTATYVNSLLDAGLSIQRLLEPGPSDESLDQWPALADHKRRPAFLVIRADR
jgi:ubiquinone/menaquinone biosynthesis C-methylase UbiE